jgi:SAM-dependent methyltransferase
LAGSVLDVQTGGAEVFSGALESARRHPDLVAATESWPPNVEIARMKLAPFGGGVAHVGDEQDLPYDSVLFDLVISRHPTVVIWDEISRVLRSGGIYFSQQVGPGSNRELTEFMMGPQPVSDRRSPQRAATGATEAGLEILDLRAQTLEVRFFDVGAVIYFLRKVLWTVPGFTVDAYMDRLQSMYDVIHREKCFVSHAQRFLIEARKP